LSSCPAGTTLNGLNYFKGKTDPVALPDEAYPSWLWKCLEVQKKDDAAADADAGDEFCAFNSFFSTPAPSPLPLAGDLR
jgi:large subunit ribosomal protein L54